MPFVAALVCFAACFLPWHTIESIYGAILFLGVSALLPAWPSDKVKIGVGPGSISLRGGITSRTKIRTSDVVGGSTARLGDKIFLTLSIGKQPSPPVSIELDSEEDARRIRDALAIGHDGFGTVLWPVGRPTTSSARDFFAFSCVMLALIQLVGHFIDPDAWYTLLAAGFAWLSLFTYGLLALDVSSRIPPYLALRADGIHHYKNNRWTRVGFDDIRGIQRDGNTLVVWKASDPMPLAIPLSNMPSFYVPSPAAVEQIVAQGNAAGARAQGARPEKAEVETPLDVLHRYPGEDVRAWLSRVELAASSIDVGGYRGGALSERDLWTLFEDPDADPDLRVAAARILGRVVRDRAARERLTVIAAAVRDIVQGKRIRVALDEDLEEAATELARMETRSLEVRAFRPMA